MLILIIYILFNLISQVLVKKASQSSYTNGNYRFLVMMYSNYRVLLAYMVTFINIFIWIFALRVVSLSTATVLASSNYVLIVFVDKIFFNEEIKARNLIGAILISLGVLIDAVYN